MGATKKMGRPTLYSKELAARICAEISVGSSLRTVCKAEDMPDASSVFLWLHKYEDFSQQYARACQERSEAMAEDILDISDDGSNDWMEKNFGGQEAWVTNGEALQRSKLRVDTRKWLMAKMKPKKYGDKLDLTSDGKALPTPITPLQINMIDTTDDINKQGSERVSVENHGDIPKSITDLNPI